MKLKGSKRTLICLLLWVILTPVLGMASEDDKTIIPWLEPLILGKKITITVSGKITIPNHNPSGQLWVVIDGLDGNFYGAGPSDVSGNFSIKASIPKATKRVLVYGLDPNDPEHYAMAYMEMASTLDNAVVTGLTKSDTKPLLFNVNAASTADVFVSMASGLPRPQFTDYYRNKAEELAGIYDLSPPKLCSVEPLPVTIVPDYPPTVAQAFDTFVQSDGSLIYRLKMATNFASKNVISPNKAATWGSRLDSFIDGMAGTLAMFRVRTMLRVLGSDWGVRGQLTKESISLEELTLATEIIFGGNNTYGAGNCREKGVVGAYIASRFNDFKAIAHVGAEIPDYSSDHAFAIACKKDWDLGNLISKHSPEAAIPNSLFESDCILIDPWRNQVVELTPDSVSGLNWNRIVHVMTVDMMTSSSVSGALAASELESAELAEGPTGFGVISNPPTSIHPAVSSSENQCQACATCPTHDELTASACGSFSIPVEPDEYVVWYMDNVRCWDAPRVYATNGTGYKSEQLTCNIPGGGIDCSIKVEKKILAAGFTSQKEAEAWFCSQITKRWYHYWCNHRGPRVETGDGSLYTLQISCDLSEVPYEYP